jgi:hypothetical protein
MVVFSVLAKSAVFIGTSVASDKNENPVLLVDRTHKNHAFTFIIINSTSAGANCKHGH